MIAKIAGGNQGLSEAPYVAVLAKGAGGTNGAREAPFVALLMKDIDRDWENQRGREP